MNTGITIKKLAFILAAAVLLSAFAVGCSKEPAPKAHADVNEVYQKLIATGYLPELTAVPERDLSEIYGIDKGKLSQWIFAMSENYSIDAGEVAIFEVNDEAYAPELAQKLQNHIDRIKSVSESYSPEQSAKLEPVEVKTVGSYVYLIVGENYNELMKIMRDNIG